ncbi:unnamed protein product, partial [Rotaria sp. Silwood2]
NNNHPLLKQIDKWEQESIKKIQQTANEARQQIEKLIGSQKEKVSQELHDLAEQLRKARIDDDFVETDLLTWTKILEELEYDINNISSSTAIHEDPTKLLVAKISIDSTMQQHLEDERFGKSMGNVCIADTGHLAYHLGPERSDAFVCGKQEYSSGKYKIQFIMNKKNSICVTSFNIISKSTSIATNEFIVEESSYGWYSNDDICCGGADLSSYKLRHDMKGETTIEIELLLDCDNQKISYFNERTKNRRAMNVNIRKCPFPWQLLFYLYDVEDSVRLVSSTKLL